MTAQVVDQSSQVSQVNSSLYQNIAAITFGALVIFAVGFLPMEVAHNAAHDTRHALAFPCH
jgi:cobalt transporter subunit CbtB